MTIIKILRDDEGLLSLLRQNKATIDIEGNVDETEPYPAIRQKESRLQDKEPRSRDRRRHTVRSTRIRPQIDRRQQQRRQRNIPVLLDTRSSFERRTQLRRDNDPPRQDNNLRTIGFDKFV